MPGSGNKSTIRTLLTACPVRSGDVYQRYVSGLYRQALLTLGDSALAVRVVSDVIADECALAPAQGRDDDVRHRLAESVFRRCQELAFDPARRDCRPEEQQKVDAKTRIRHGDHRGSCWSRARADGGQVAAGCAAVHGDEKDVTRAASRSLAASCPRASCHRHHVRPAWGEWDAYTGGRAGRPMRRCTRR